MHFKFCILINIYQTSKKKHFEKYIELTNQILQNMYHMVNIACNINSESFFFVRQCEQGMNHIVSSMFCLLPLVLRFVLNVVYHGDKVYVYLRNQICSCWQSIDHFLILQRTFVRTLRLK